MKEPIKNTKAQENKKGLIEEFQSSLSDLQKKINGLVYPLIMPPLSSIDEDALFEVYPDLRKIGKRKKLHILLYSYGGDAHTAFHIGRLLQEYATEELVIYILREAKSAATLLACASDKIIFSEISELGPMDPQIRDSAGGQRFSPLAIKHIIELLANENKLGHNELVKTLAEKLPAPLILGEHLKSLETGKDYLSKLLKARMLKDDHEKAQSIAEKLVTGYPDHGYCIDYKEAEELGLKVERADENIDIELFRVMENFKMVWDTFEKLIRESKDKSDPKAKEAIQILVGIRRSVTNLLDDELKEEKKNKEAKSGITS